MRGAGHETADAGKPARVADFEEKYRRDEDPWGYRTSWYERRKYATTVAALPRERYRLVWEPACSIGVLTRLLAGRADRVLASDASPTAIAAARTGSLPAGSDIDWSVRVLPGRPEAAAGTVDLVVLSEILYYLNDHDRVRVLDDAAAMLAPGGDLVVVHWQPQAGDAHVSGREASDWVRTRPGWDGLVRHDDEFFALDVLRRR